MPPGQHQASIIPDELLEAIAERYGFRPGDYSLVWDGGEFDPSRAMHELAILTGDARRAIARFSHAEISQHDPWKCFGKLEAAFKQLGRRERARGV